MLPLIGAELRRITGRRGAFYGSILFALIIMGIAIAVDDAQSGATAMDRTSTAGRYAGLLGVVVMGALAGSYDTANGTMRYLVLTGVPRWQLAVVRLVGMMLAVLPLAFLILVISYLASMGVGDGPSGKAVGEAVWAVLATLWTWGIVSTSIGMLMRSNGSAIAVSVVLFFGGALITALVAEFISETLANYLLPTVFEQVAALIKPGGEEDLALSLGAAFAVLAVWLVVLTAAAVARVQRDEY
jgi:ABC-type transport system involved in multi-copper enzyme maturation permease subunit